MWYYDYIKRWELNPMIKISTGELKFLTFINKSYIVWIDQDWNLLYTIHIESRYLDRFRVGELETTN